jgi:hypothetical protein
MKAITDSNGDLGIFAVIYDSGKLWLDGDDGSPEIFWVADDRFVFLRRKPWTSGFCDPTTPESATSKLAICVTQ